MNGERSPLPSVSHGESQQIQKGTEQKGRPTGPRCRVYAVTAAHSAPAGPSWPCRVQHDPCPDLPVTIRPPLSVVHRLSVLHILLN